MRIQYVEGDATNPHPEHRPCIIAHIVNDKGGWGAGFSGALSKRYPEAETYYRVWMKAAEFEGDPLGKTSLHSVKETTEILILHMCAQHHWRPHVDHPVRYEALALCLQSLDNFANEFEHNIVMPRIGSGLAGGHWSIIEPMIEEHVEAQVYVYDFKP